MFGDNFFSVIVFFLQYPVNRSLNSFRALIYSFLSLAAKIDLPQYIYRWVIQN